MEEKLDFLVGNGRGDEAGVSSSPERLDVVDRKRLKERLKQAIAARSADSFHERFRSTSIIEKVFGIRQGDARVGKERSRYSDDSAPTSFSHTPLDH